MSFAGGLGRLGAKVAARAALLQRLAMGHAGNGTCQDGGGPVPTADANASRRDARHATSGELVADRVNNLATALGTTADAPLGTAAESPPLQRAQPDALQPADARHTPPPTTQDRRPHDRAELLRRLRGGGS